MKPSSRGGAKFGQHFLIDHSVAHEMVAHCRIHSSSILIEIGPGRCALTDVLLSSCAYAVIAIERDLKFHHILHQRMQEFQGRFHAVIADALVFSKFASSSQNVLPIIVANLPYNVSVPLILQMLRHISAYDHIVLMVQTEVAERLSAPVNTKHYGRLSVLAQAYADVTLLFHVPPSAFNPTPKVNSSVIRILPKRTQLSCTFQSLSSITARVFQHRRKIVRACLTPFMDDTITIDLQHRPQMLDIATYVKLATLLEQKTNASF